MVLQVVPHRFGPPLRQPAVVVGPTRRTGVADQIDPDFLVGRVRDGAVVLGDEAVQRGLGGGVQRRRVVREGDRAAQDVVEVGVQAGARERHGLVARVGGVAGVGGVAIAETCQVFPGGCLVGLHEQMVSGRLRPLAHGQVHRHARPEPVPARPVQEEVVLAAPAGLDQGLQPRQPGGFLGALPLVGGQGGGPRARVGFGVDLGGQRGERGRADEGRVGCSDPAGVDQRVHELHRHPLADVEHPIALHRLGQVLRIEAAAPGRPDHRHGGVGVGAGERPLLGLAECVVAGVGGCRRGAAAQPLLQVGRRGGGLLVRDRLRLEHWRLGGGGCGGRAGRRGGRVHATAPAARLRAWTICGGGVRPSLRYSSTSAASRCSAAIGCGAGSSAAACSTALRMWPPDSVQ